MTRYVRQQDDYSCAPVALLNLCKWAGFRCSYDSEFYRWIKRSCRARPGHGSEFTDIDATLHRLASWFGWVVRKRYEAPTQEIRDELKKGNAVLFCGYNSEGKMHMALLTDGIHGVNWFDDETVKPLPWSERRRQRNCWFVRVKQ